MKELEEAPMRAMEERVRDAFGAAAETITTQDLPGLPAPARRTRITRSLWAWAPRMRTQVLVPAAAAASVAVIAAAATVAVPKLLAGPAAAPTGGALAGAPKFFASIQSDTPVVDIQNSATGHVVSSFGSPTGRWTFQLLTRLGEDNTYVVAALKEGTCSYRLYRFSIDASGHPTGLTLIRTLPGAGLEELAGSADGKALAYVSAACRPKDSWEVGVIHLATGQATTWTYPFNIDRSYTGVGSLSLTANGSELGFLIDATKFNGANPNGGWVLPTDAPGGLITSHARKVLLPSTHVRDVILSNSGASMYVVAQAVRANTTRRLVLYNTATGKPVRVLAHIAGGINSALPVMTLDASGQHLLTYGYDSSRRVTMINVVTGHQTTLKLAVPLITDGGFTTAAW